MNMTTRAFATGILLVSAMAAQQFNYSNSGGSFVLGSSLSMTGPMNSPAGTYTFNCPVTSVPPGTYRAKWVCNGGTLGMQSNDGLTVLTGTVTAGTLVETTLGGSHGVPLTYYYSFSGTFSGALTLNGEAQAVLGYATEASGGSSSPLGSGTLASGTTLINSHYEPVYITDTYNYRVARIDDMLGDNLITLGQYGSGPKQFELPWGLYVDSTGKIYVTDATTCRLIRMDDMLGTNWVSLGTCGSGSQQFNNPGGIFLDSSGNIYVADTGNDRIVQIADMSGDHWVTYGITGTGTGQLSHPTSVTVNGTGQIFVADGGNGRIVRIDNMLGANWTSYNGAGFSSQMDIKLDSIGRIYVADTYGNRMVRIDDMSGTNLTVLGGPGASVQFINPYGVFVDRYGTIYIADSRDYRIVMTDDMLGDAFTSYDGSPSAPIFDSPTSMFATPATSPIAVPTYTASSLTFTDQVVGTVSGAQSITVANIGSAPLLVNSIAPSGDFQQNNTCDGSLPAGQSCSISVTFKPSAGGTRTGAITVDYASSASKTITLSGIGSLVSVSPTALNFGNVNAGGKAVSMTVTVANPGAASAGISSVKLAAPPVYRLKNACPTLLAAGASCTLTVKFIPQEAKYYTGTLTVKDASGTAQVVSITGTGVSN